MKFEGFSSRAIATALGISKSGVNDLLQRDQQLRYNPRDVAFKNDGPKILVFDTETAAATALTFGRFKVNLSQDNILDNGGWILCACWRWLGEYETHRIFLTPTEVAEKDDSRIVAKLFELYEEADAVLAHNSQGFDHKVVQTRAIASGFPPLPQVKVLDTLQLVKKYLKLPSNRLDAIGEFFGLGRKISTGGISLWRRVQEGDVQAMEDMVTYCEQDVDLLYDVYLRTRQLGRAGSDFNAALYYDDDLVRCRVCGSVDVEATGRTTETSLNTFDEVRCNDCGAVHRHRQAKTTKEKRKSLLM
jgi:predicted PolB exonuclease-like 3'-5' exonuclease